MDEFTPKQRQSYHTLRLQLIVVANLQQSLYSDLGHLKAQIGHGSKRTESLKVTCENPSWSMRLIV